MTITNVFYFQLIKRILGGLGKRLEENLVAGGRIELPTYGL